MLPRSRITVGIDAGKCQHQAAVYDPARDRVVRRLRVPVSRAGFEHLRTVLAQMAPDPSQVRVGLEASGHYHLTLAEFLTGSGYAVAPH